MSELKAYEPSRRRPWDRAAAAHLLRRAGLGASESQLQTAVELGPRATVDRLIDEPADCERHDELNALGADIAIRDDIDLLRGWWLHRMVHTTRPLHTRLAVFWHDHFATSNAKVRGAPMMLQQLRTIEHHAMGCFGEMLAAMSRDPAMIAWLDGDRNIKGRPNENFARELFELFALGVGHYTEDDIKASARAFTGWHQRRGRFRFVPRNHDTSDKTVFGETGPFGGDDIVRMTLARPACSRFIAAKLLREFLCPNPSVALVEGVAEQLRETEFDIAAALRMLLMSAAMHGPRYRRVHIKSPVALAVGIVRSLETRVPAEALADAVSQMGQRLFEPPSVKGWDGHRAWLNSATMLVRLNAASRAVSSGEFEPDVLCERYELDTRASVLAFCGNVALDGLVPAKVRSQLADLSGKRGELVRKALRLLFCCPEYQMA